MVACFYLHESKDFITVNERKDDGRLRWRQTVDSGAFEKKAKASNDRILLIKNTTPG